MELGRTSIDLGDSTGLELVDQLAAAHHISERSIASINQSIEMAVGMYHKSTPSRTAVNKPSLAGSMGITPLSSSSSASSELMCSVHRRTSSGFTVWRLMMVVVAERRRRETNEWTTRGQLSVEASVARIIRGCVLSDGVFGSGACVLRASFTNWPLACLVRTVLVAAPCPGWRMCTLRHRGTCR